MPDFSYYELYKILNRIQHRDNILRSENISDIQEKKSAAGKLYNFNFMFIYYWIFIFYLLIIGYIFDFDTCISDINIEILRSWPSDDDINDAIRIASENANNFANILKMHYNQYTHSPTLLIPEENYNNNHEIPIEQNNSIEQVGWVLGKRTKLTKKIFLK